VEKMKQCTLCKKEFPATLDYFHKCKKGKNGLYPRCKKCELEYAKKHNSKKETKEKKAIQQKEYREKNKEKRAAYIKQWRKKNKEKLINDKKVYYESNKEKLLSNYKLYREKNKETILQKGKIYRENNRDKRIKQEKKYLQTEAGKNIRYNGRLKYISEKNNIEFTPIKRTELLNRDNWLCQVCKIKVHDRNSGNWNTPDKAHIDHIIPIIKGGSSTPENLQVLCRSCNILKGDKTGNEVKELEKTRTRNY
jgi:5-methylcytosine-specific restriction endonuclease McrA